MTTHEAAVDVLIVENHPLYARALGATLSGAPGLRVAGHARTVTEALEQAAAIRPRAVVMISTCPEAAVSR
jgi:DNA-binding NarL/FixJ family response regulator